MKDMIYDYTNILDRLILLSPCEYDDVFMNSINIASITLDKEIVNTISNSIYSVNFET